MFKQTIFFRGKSISIAYSESVFIVLRIQYAMRMRHIVICYRAASTIFAHIIS
jgi:hypothetical protein